MGWFTTRDMMSSMTGAVRRNRNTAWTTTGNEVCLNWHSLSKCNATIHSHIQGNASWQTELHYAHARSKICSEGGASPFFPLTGSHSRYAVLSQLLFDTRWH